MGHLGLTLELAAGVFALLVVLPLAGAAYQRAGSAKDARQFPPPGRLIDLGDCRLHLDLRGSGSPTVVFEAGIGATSLSWRPIQPAVAALTSTASYDRAWLGWSEPSARPRTIARLVEELRALLERAGVTGPKIVVAHSYGAWVALAYLTRHPEEIAGLVLIDPVASSEWNAPPESQRNMLRLGVNLSRRGAWLARTGLVRFALNRLMAGGRSLPKLIGRAGSSGHANTFLERIVDEVRKLPREVWPMVRAHWSNPKCFEGMAQYLESLPESAAVVAEILDNARTGSVPDIPLIVLSAANATAAQRAEQKNLAHIFNGRLEVVPDTGHWLQMDRPDVVIGSIQEILDRVA